LVFELRSHLLDAGYILDAFHQRRKNYSENPGFQKIDVIVEGRPVEIKIGNPEEIISTKLT
jgi:hypothetical protein